MSHGKEMNIKSDEKQGFFISSLHFKKNRIDVQI